MTTIDHKAITGSDAIHPCDFYQSADPGAVGANKTWKDTTTTPPVFKRRNAGDTAWDTVFDPGNYQVKSLLTTLGDTIYASAGSTWARVAGNITATRKFYRQLGDGANSAAPVWDTLVAGDLAAHVIATNVALGSQHTISGATAGQVLRASGATAANFQALASGDIPNLPASIITSGALAVPRMAGHEPNYFQSHVNGGGGFDIWYPLGQVTNAASAAAAMVANRIVAIPFVAPARGGTIDRLAFNVTTLLAGNGRCGIYTSTSETNLYPDQLVVDGGSLSTGTTGVKSATVSVTLTPGAVYWAVYTCDAAASLRAYAGGVLNCIMGIDSALGSSANRCIDGAFAFAALPATFPASIGTTVSNVMPVVYARYSA